MDDLVERLRDYPNNRGHKAMRELAADEIERLREALDDIGNNEIVGCECCEEFDYKYFYNQFIKTAQEALNND